MLISRDRFHIDDYSIILVEDLFDDQNHFYDLNLKCAVEEQTKGFPLVSCNYTFELDDEGDRVLKSFLAYTENRVIFMLMGIGLSDTLLYSVSRFPSSIK